MQQHHTSIFILTMLVFYMDSERSAWGPSPLFLFSIFPSTAFPILFKWSDNRSGLTWVITTQSCCPDSTLNLTVAATRGWGDDYIICTPHDFFITQPLETVLQRDTLLAQVKEWKMKGVVMHSTLPCTQYYITEHLVGACVLHPAFKSCDTCASGVVNFLLLQRKTRSYI